MGEVFRGQSGTLSLKMGGGGGEGYLPFCKFFLPGGGGHPLAEEIRNVVLECSHKTPLDITITSCGGGLF